MRTLVFLLRSVLGLVLGFGFFVSVAQAQNGALPDAKPKVQISLVPERKAIAPGATVTIAFHQSIRKDWHTYWLNPGDSGAPTAITWHLPPGWKAGPIQWPYPQRIPVGPLMNFGYSGQVSLLTDVTAPADARPGDTAMLEADAMWLVCSDVCVPEEGHVTLPIAIAAAPAPPDSGAAPLFAQTRAQLPHASPWKAVFDAADKRFALLIESPELAAARPRDVEFFPYADGFMTAAAPQRIGTAARGLVIESETGWKLATAAKRAGVKEMGGVLVLTGTDGQRDVLSLTAAPGPVPVSSVSLTDASALPLAEAMVFALLGGLVLNLMPCVFPVLSMKAVALAAKAERPEAARVSALAYGAGAVLSFVVLAGVLLGLRAGGAAVGWGFQLQQPLFVTALALLMFAVGLNLSGLYELDAGLAGAGDRLTHRSGAAGSFFTGVLAVVVATPCTAPFMGAAMGYALTASVPVAVAVFVALGVGFALPFTLLGFWPRALRFLPRPGTWMVTLRQALAFPMYGAALWLVWVLSQQAGSDGAVTALAAALVLAFGLWVYGRSQRASGFRRAAGFATVLLALAGMAALAPKAADGAAQPQASSEAHSALAYEPYSAARLAALRAEGRPVFINATAAWCITCLVNERVALSSSGLQRAFTSHKVAALKADWTNRNGEITRLLAAHGRDGVPLYLYYPPGAEAPVVLPQLLTESTIVAALGR